MIFNQRGFTFVETLVAAAVLGASVVIFSGVTKYFNQKNKDTIEAVVVSNYVNTIYNNIQSNLNIYQISYDSKAFHDAKSPDALAKILPLAWDHKVVTDVEKCPSCPGRMGYVIEPVNGYRGLFKLTIRVTHPKIEGFKDYVMLLIGK